MVVPGSLLDRVRLLAGRIDIPLGIGVEGRLAPRAAEIDRATSVLGGEGRLVPVDGHAANRIARTAPERERDEERGNSDAL